MRKLDKDAAIYIDGGAGRVIAAIPAIEKFAKLNPDNDFIVLIPGWDYILWGNQTLQDRAYGVDTKGIFDTQIKHRQLINLEPYRIYGYYNQELSLAEAIDQELNLTEDHSDLEAPRLFLQKQEEKWAANVMAQVKDQQKKQKTIIMQPFGRSARVDNGDIIDDSSRSIEPEVYLKLVEKLSSKYNLIFFGEEQFFIQQDSFTFKLQADLRGWMALIEASDYFVGCDSVGQHMARAFDKKGTVVVGSTDAVNTSYPDWFNVIENDKVKKKYSPIRICGLDGALADRFNDRVMDFDDEQIEKIYRSIVKDIEGK